jgi:hypothetical protein
MVIFGRSPNLLLALAGAIFNTVLVFHVGGFDPTAEQIGSVNVLLLAAVAFIANTDSITRAAGDVAHSRLRKSSNGTTRASDTTITTDPHDR